MTSLVILGSTGSLGTQVLDYVAKNPQDYRVLALAANGNVNLMAEQIRRFRPQFVAMQDPAAAHKLTALTRMQVEFGEDEIGKLAVLPTADLIVNTVSGLSGVKFTWTAVQAGKALVLGNKESLLVNSVKLRKLIRRTNSKIFLLDSELSAVQQLLDSSVACGSWVGHLQDKKLETKSKIQSVRTLYLTASGGPFLNFSKTELEQVTPLSALSHPVWKMGPKITVDSATLLNKVFEIGAARSFFRLHISRIKALLHPPCLVHAIAEWRDGSVSAVVHPPDMEHAVAFALSRGKKRLPAVRVSSLKNLAQKYPLEKILPHRFPVFDLGISLLKCGEVYGEALVKADEIIVEKFLRGEVKFKEIAEQLRLIAIQTHTIYEKE